MGKMALAASYDYDVIWLKVGLENGGKIDGT